MWKIKLLVQVSFIFEPTGSFNQIVPQAQDTSALKQNGPPATGSLSG